MKSRMRRGCIFLLAMIMAMAMNVGGVFAQDEYEPVAGSANSVKIAKKLDLKGSTSGPEHTVTFNVEYMQQSSTPKVAISGSVSPVQLTFGGAVSEKEEYIDFSAVKFPEPGRYRFKVTETIPSGLGIRTVSGTETTYYVDVYVENVNDTAGHSGLEVKDYRIMNGSFTKVNSILFQNEWDNYRVKVKKEVTGNQGDKAHAFQIYLGLTNFSSSRSVTVRWVSGTPAAGTADNKVTAANPVTIRGGTNSTNYVTLYLKDDDQVIVEGMTSGMNVTLTEPDPDGHTVTGTITTARSVVNINDQLLTVVNHKSGSIPTGIFINNWPYIAVVLIALAVCVVFIRRRKARYEYEADL